MRKSLKKMLSILLILFLVIPLFPLNVLADGSEEVKVEEKQAEVPKEIKEIEEKEVNKEELQQTNLETQKNEYIVTFSVNSRNVVVSQNIYENEKVIQPATPVKEGHDFKGWFTDDKFATRWNFENDVVTKDITLYAKWDIKEFIVIFKDHDGTELSNEIVEYGKDTVSPKKPSREKYIFTGWDKEFINVKSNLVVTAQYKIDKFIKLNSLDISGDHFTKTNITVSAAADSTNGVLYQYWVKDLKVNLWTMIKDYSTDKTATWTPKKEGKYLYGVHIKDKNSDKRLDAYLYKDIKIENIKSTIKNLVIKGSNTIGKHTINADAVSENEVLYQYWVKDLKINKWTMIKDYSKDKSATWIPKKEGKYLYGIHIKDKKSKDRLDTHLYQSVNINKLPKAELNSLDITGEHSTKTNLIISADANSSNGVLYQYWVKDLKINRWKMIKDYSTDKTVTWTPKKKGTYIYGVHIKDEYSKDRLDTHLYKSIQIAPVKSTIKALNIKGPNTIGKHIIASDAVSEDEVLYQYWVKDLKVNRWKMIKNYSKDKTATWFPKREGEYLYGIHIKDKKSKGRLDTHLYQSITINKLEKAKLTSLNITGTSNTNNTHTINAKGNSTNGVLYQYWVKDLKINRWKIIKDYSTAQTATWSPKTPGNYLYGVHIKDEYSNDRLDSHLYKPITIKGGLKALYGKTIMLDPGHGGYDSGAINGSLGIKEKNYNNALSLKIRERLIALGANVTFTRNPWEDKLIHLHDRTPIVNKQKPDLMLSVHHDSSSNKSVSGMSVHYSSYRPGMDTSNAYVKYNGREYKFIREIRNWWDPVRKTRDPGIVYLDNGKEKIVNINDVMVYDNRKPSDVVKKSEKLAKNLYGSLGKLNYSKKYSYIRDHNLHMTRWSNVPSALIEAGFISNNTEVKRVGKDSERNKIAQAVVNAITSYFN